MSDDNKNVLVRSKQYVSEAWDELKKVTYPTRQETVQAGIVTLVLIVSVAVVASLFDLVFGQLMKAILA